MNHRFDELTKSMAQAVTRRASLKKFGLGLAGMALAGLLALRCMATSPAAGTSTVLDAAGDAVFPFPAAALGNPASIHWAVASECDPVSIPDEQTRSVLLVDYMPDHGYATWPAQ